MAAVLACGPRRGVVASVCGASARAAADQRASGSMSSFPAVRAGTAGVDVHRSVTLTDRGRDRGRLDPGHDARADDPGPRSGGRPTRGRTRDRRGRRSGACLTYGRSPTNSTATPNTPARRGLRAALGPDRAGLTDSELEELFVAIWWPTGLPRPQTRFHIDPGDGGLLIRADFAWPRRSSIWRSTAAATTPQIAAANVTTGAINGSSAPNGRCCASVTTSSTTSPTASVAIVWELLAPRLPPELRRPWP